MRLMRKVLALRKKEKNKKKRKAKCIEASQVHYTHIKVIFALPARIGLGRGKEKKKRKSI